MSDYISREAAIEEILNFYDHAGFFEQDTVAKTIGIIKAIPGADVADVIRCKDCRWWDKFNDVRGYCMAAKHGYFSGRWEITIHRKYDGDFYCADAERRENEAD